MTNQYVQFIIDNLPEGYSHVETAEDLQDLLDEGEYFSGCEDDEIVKATGITSVEQEGGREGEGEYCTLVVKFKERYFRFDFSYYSHHGLDFDGTMDSVEDVFPVKKTLIVYE